MKECLFRRHISNGAADLNYVQWFNEYVNHRRCASIQLVFMGSMMKMNSRKVVRGARWASDVGTVLKILIECFFQSFGSFMCPSRKKTVDNFWSRGGPLRRKPRGDWTKLPSVTSANLIFHCQSRLALLIWECEAGCVFEALCRTRYCIAFDTTINMMVHSTITANYTRLLKHLKWGWRGGSVMLLMRETCYCGGFKSLKKR